MSVDDPRRRFRRTLLATDLLQRYIQVGYAPDVWNCALIIQELLRIQDPAEETRSITERGRGAFEKVERLAGPAGVQETTGVRRAELRSEMANAAIGVGSDLVRLPVLRLLELVNRNVGRGGSSLSGGLFAGNEFSQADADSKVSFRWYLRGGGVVHGRVLARNLRLDSSLVSGLLESFPASQWRARDSDGHWFRAEGAVGASDVRLIGGASTVTELVIRSATDQEALQLFSRMAAAIGEGVLEEIASVEPVVRRILVEEELPGV